jgi:queuosine precursor transporter
VNSISRCISPAIFVAAIAMANLSIAWFGPWVSPINSFFLIGLDLSLRDRLHDRWRGNYLWFKMFTLIAMAGLISYMVNPAAGIIAIASCVAFVAAQAGDAAVYQGLWHRGFLVRANGSNAVGAGIDSVLFPTIAFGVLMPEIIAAQFAAKVGGGAMWAWVLNRTRAAA